MIKFINLTNQMLCMKYYLKIDGGIGRAICATKPIQQFAEQHEKDQTYIVTSYPDIFYGLENIERIYPIVTPFLYEDHIITGEFLEPEPYNHKAYYKENRHLATVFNIILNQKDEYLEPQINLTQNELNEAKQFIEHIKKESNKKIVLVQPWGSSGGKLVGEEQTNTDETYRSFGLEFAKRLNERLLDEDYQPFLIKSGDQIGLKGAKTFNNLPIRKIIALIPFVDGVIACDSFLHHATEATKQYGSPPTIVLWGATNPTNLSYEDQTNIVSWKKVLYEPNRIPHDHQYYVDKNKGSNEFKLETIEEIMEVLKNGKSNKNSEVTRNNTEEPAQTQE